MQPSQPTLIQHLVKNNCTQTLGRAGGECSPWYILGRISLKLGHVEFLETPFLSELHTSLIFISHVLERLRTVDCVHLSLLLDHTLCPNPFHRCEGITIVCSRSECILHILKRRIFLTSHKNHALDLYQTKTKRTGATKWYQKHCAIE
jgi:hypothetical protein